MTHNIIKKAFVVAAGFTALVAGASAQTLTRHIYAYKDSTVMFRAEADDVDSIALEENKSVVALYKNGTATALYRAPYGDIDSISFTAPHATADLLDIKFDETGNCWDASPCGLLVTPTNGSGTAEVDYNQTYETWESHFCGATWGGNPANTCFKVDYSQNDYFKEELANGHTLECLFKVDYTGDLPNSEAKFFAAHEGGGTGFLICTQNRGKNGGSEITFLPNVSTNGGSNWIWATSGIVPQPGKYYHIVGVYNKDEQKAYVYVDGKLCGSADAPGDFKFANSGYRRMIVGGAPGGSSYKATNGWKGDVLFARIYSSPLTTAQVKALYQKTQDAKNAANVFVTDYSYSTGVAVKAGAAYTITGKGFAAGDKISIVSGSQEMSVPVTVTDGGAEISLPEGIVNDKRYFLYVERGNKKQTLGMCKFYVIDELPQGTKVIAHRGYWNTTGSAQNSRTSLQKAIDLHCYGSETDVWLTTDKELMVNHDASFNGVTIKDATAAQCKALKLSNDETMPTLNDLLSIVADENWTTDSTKLIIEIKDHGTDDLNIEAAETTVNAVYEAGVQDRVEYISFSLVACNALHDADSEAKVSCLNGDKTPEELSALGLSGLDYTLSVYNSNPTWISEARNLDLTTNVWTINSTDEIIKCNNLGIDYITTDNPVEALKYQTYYQNLNK